MSESSSSRDEKDIAEEGNQDVEVIYDQIRSGRTTCWSWRRQRNREAQVEGLPRAVFEARYPTRFSDMGSFSTVCKTHGTYNCEVSFFNVYKSLLVELGSRYIDRRQNQDLFDLYDICIELSGRSRRVTSNYFLLLQCSHEQNGCWLVN